MTTFPTDDLDRHVRHSITASIAAKQAILASATFVSSLSAVARLLIAALERKNKILIFGNGGSAAEAQHIAAELVGRFAVERPALPVLALTVDTSCLTATANDYGFDHVFARQLEAHGRPGDVAIGISTSGNSQNVLSAFATAKRAGLATVALTGESGGKVLPLVDHCLCVPSQVVPRIQECHTLIGHILSEIVEQALFPEQSHRSRS